MGSEAVGNGALSRAAEEYLEAVYEIQKASGKAVTSAVARRLGVRDPSATRMIRKLASLRLLEHTPYHGARLTPAGEALACRIARRRDLIRRYLMECLGCSSNQAFEEADRLEHVLSEGLEGRLAVSLGNGRADETGPASRDGADVTAPRPSGVAERRESS